MFTSDAQKYDTEMFQKRRIII